MEIPHPPGSDPRRRKLEKDLEALTGPPGTQEGWERPIRLPGIQPGGDGSGGGGDTWDNYTPPDVAVERVRAPAPSGPTTEPPAQPPVGMAPPPPPPPPPGPAAAPPPTATAPSPASGPMVGDMDLSEYAADWMQNPNRFLSDFVTQTREAGDLRRQQQREESTRGIEEWAASRGLTGSSLEGEQRIQLEQALDRNRAQEEQALTEALASYEAMDRLAAGEYGLDVFDATQRGTLAYDQMAHELALQGNELGQRESEFARNFGLDERQFSAQMDQFADQMALQREQMAQDNEHFSRALESEEARYAMDSDLRSRALDLQEQGMQMDEAFRQAQLEQDERLRTEALRLEERGMNLDDAYRYAALSQDDKFRTRALDLQKEGMDLDEAFRRAELDYRREAEERRDETTRRAILIDALKALHQVGGLGDVENLLDLIMGEGRPSNVTDDDDRPTGWQGPDDEDEDWRDDYPYEREGEEE